MLIGLTGGIGSGKSTIANALRERGFAVYDTDKEAKRILTTNPAVRSQIEYLFGSDVYQNDVYQTKRVAEQVFRDPTLLERLNKIVHPAVCFDVRHWAKAQEQQGQAFCFVESAILYESGLADECGMVVGVAAPEEVRIERTMRRDGAQREQVARRIAAQLSNDNIKARAHIFLWNDGEASITELTDSMLQNIKIAIA